MRKKADDTIRVSVPDLCHAPEQDSEIRSKRAGGWIRSRLRSLFGTSSSVNADDGRLCPSDCEQGETEIEISDTALQKVYDYFKDNFCLSKKDLDDLNPSIAKSIASLETTGEGLSDLFFKAIYDFPEEAYEGKMYPKFIEQIFKSTNNKHIPASAYNAVLLMEGGGKALLERAVSNYIKDKQLPSLSTEKLDVIISNLLYKVRDVYLSDPDKADAPADDPKYRINISQLLDYDSVISELRTVKKNIEYNKNIETIKSKREKAIKEIEEDFEILKSWKETPLAMSDDEMSEIFRKRDIKVGSDKFLTSYYGSARIGLLWESLGSAAEFKISKDGKDAQDEESIDCKEEQFPEMLMKFKRNILNELEPVYTSSKGRFFTKATKMTDEETGREFDISANINFTAGGTEAAIYLFNSCIKKGDKVLVTRQEYDGIIKNLNSRGVEIIFCPEYDGDDEDFKNKIEKLITDNGIKFMVISDISRHGTRFPLSIFSELRDKHNESKEGTDKIRLIVDACQAVGRKEIDYYRKDNKDHVNPDAVFASCHKGCEIAAEKAGFVVATDDFCEAYDRYEADSDDASAGQTAMNQIAQTVFACAPGSLRDLNGIDALIKIPKNIFEKLISSVHAREMALLDMSHKFAELVRAMKESSEHGERIKIFNPHFKNLYKNGKVNEKALSGIFECRIEGLDLKTVKRIAEDYGIELDFDWGGSNEGSFRIAFNPYMNKDSVKILGRFLQECVGRSVAENPDYNVMSAPNKTKADGREDLISGKRDSVESALDECPERKVA